MKNEAYGRYLSEVYDRLNSDIVPEEWASFCERCFEKFSGVQVQHVCEIACGTGSVAMFLAKKGY